MSLSVLLMIGSILAVSKLDVALVLARLDGVGDTFMACLVVAWTGPVLIVVTCSSARDCDRCDDWDRCDNWDRCDGWDVDSE